jgi:hypothetical protein
MTGFAAAPLPLRRFAGNVWLVVLAAIVIALAVGSFVLGRVTGSDDGSSIQPVHTVYVQTHDGGSAAAPACRVHQPC